MIENDHFRSKDACPVPARSLQHGWNRDEKGCFLPLTGFMILLQNSQISKHFKTMKMNCFKESNFLLILCQIRIGLASSQTQFISGPFLI